MVHPTAHTTFWSKQLLCAKYTPVRQALRRPMIGLRLNYTVGGCIEKSLEQGKAGCFKGKATSAQNRCSEFGAGSVLPESQWSEKYGPPESDPRAGSLARLSWTQGAEWGALEPGPFWSSWSCPVFNGKCLKIKLMSFPAVDGGQPGPPPWHPALVIFLLNKGTGCLPSGGDLGVSRSLRLENILASGDRWPLTLHLPDLWPQPYRTYDTVLAATLSSSPIKLWQASIHPAANPASQPSGKENHEALSRTWFFPFWLRLQEASLSGSARAWIHSG